MTVLLAFVAALLFACGAWLLMQRRLSRIIIGIGLLGHGANMLLISAGGTAGREPIIGPGDGPYSDPLPQALGLTAVVITFGVTALLLALGFRSWQITGDDRVEDDLEDRLVERRRDDLDEFEPTDSSGDAEVVDVADVVVDVPEGSA